jgi:hypothetical protein
MCAGGMVAVLPLKKNIVISFGSDDCRLFLYFKSVNKKD